MKGFENIVPYLTHPLALVGFVLLLFFAFHKALIGSGLIPPVSQQTGGRLLQALLRYGFIIALLVIVLGFGLRFFELQKAAQRAAAEHRAELAGQARQQLELRLREKERELEIVETDAQSREQFLREQMKELTETVKALAQGKAPEVDDALEQLAQGDTEAAKRHFQKVLNAKARDIKEAAAAARHLGALAFLDNTDEALKAYRRAVELDPEDTESWNQLGHLFRRVGNLEAAEDAYRQVLSLGETGEEQLTVAAAYGGLGHIYRIHGEWNRAETMYRRALDKYEALDVKKGKADVYTSIGTLYMLRRDLNSAETMYKTALGIYEAIPDLTGLAIGFLNLGTVYWLRNDVAHAEDMYLEALKFNKALSRPEGMANAYGSLGILYRHQGDLGKAKRMFLESRAINDALHRKEGLARDYLNLGNVYREHAARTCEIYKKDAYMKHAEEMYLSALGINESIGRKEGIAVSCSNLGKVYEHFGDVAQAKDMYLKSITLFHELDPTRAEEVQRWLDELREAKDSAQ